MQTRKKDVGKALGLAAAVLGLGATAFYVGRRMRRRLGEPMRRAITIARPREEVYAFWRKLENLPQFMRWIERVEDRGNKVSHWSVKAIGGPSYDYDAEITEDIPGRCLQWRTLPNATVPMRGKVEFLEAPGNRGTELVVEIQVAAPLGKTIASHEAAGDLRRLKQILELGEIVQSDASIHRRPHPAQPSEGGTP